MKFNYIPSPGLRPKLKSTSSTASGGTHGKCVAHDKSRKAHQTWDFHKVHSVKVTLVTPKVQAWTAALSSPNSVVLTTRTSTVTTRGQKQPDNCRPLRVCQKLLDFKFLRSRCHTTHITCVHVKRVHNSQKLSLTKCHLVPARTLFSRSTKSTKLWSRMHCTCGITCPPHVSTLSCLHIY